ncbi:MAG: protein kinase, partial [Bryobacteraceae bacterium]
MITSIGEFEVKGELGHGGMGTVYLAHDPRVGRDVAVKVLTNEGDGDLLARFRSEAGTTAKLTHKNIVTIYAFGEQDGMPYIVMELLQGENLGDVIGKRRPLTLLEKVRILHQVAEGLSFAHQKNVIHRDIKPRNIMLLPDGTAKVMDFGIARVTGSDSTRRTQKGYLLGTIAYMAPEQFTRGMDADQLVDIFAYGDVAYELITGEHPFGEGEAGALISRITATEPRTIRELAPDCPELLASIIQQLLAKDRDLRYQSLRDLVLDMEPVLFQLRHDRAAQILAEAHPLVEQGQADAALAKVKEAVELDPMNREADQLKKQLQEELRRKAVRGKVTAMVADAERKVAQRSFSEAILVLESALQLDKTDTIQARLEEIRREQEKVKRAVQLLGEARRQENLGTAVAKAAEALEIDPHNTQAPHVLKRLREELDKRGRRLREALQAASACAAKQVFDDAFRILDKVAEEQGELPEIAEERARVRAAQAEFKLRQRWRSFDEAVVSARAAMNGGDLAQARAVIESLAAGYADLPRAAERTKQLGADLARREREAEIARITQEADDLSRQEQFEAGHAKLDAALARYPGDPALQAALEKLLQTKAARERADAIAVSEANIGRLHREGALEPALQAAKAAAGEYPDYKEFQDLVTEIAAELQERQRRARIDEAARRATALLESDPSQAGELLRSTLAEVGPEAYLESLLTAAQRAAGRRQEQQVVNRILAQVQKLRASQQWRDALDELERAIEQYPRRSELRLSASEVRAELYRIARAEKLRAITRGIQEALAEGDLHKCGTSIDEARKEFPGEAGIEQLAAELARAQRAQGISALTASVRQSLSRDDVEGAARQLAGSSEWLAATPEWNDLKAETDERREYLNALETARQLAGQSRFGEVELFLAPYVKAGHKRAEQMQRTISQQRVRAEEEAREREEAEKRELERKEQERKAAEARARAEQERKAAEARAREEQEREAAEAREEQERKAAEARAREEQERKAAEARAREEHERKAAEARAREEQERKAAEARARE